MEVQLKNVVVGLLVAYVVADIGLALTGKIQNPSVIEKLMENISTESGILVAIVSLVAGVGAWYLLEHGSTM